ncbi:MAG: dihydroxy-acid dehydratase [Clostridia bacterium]|nr:dihydroxy-acid dehydratase [Clostridia bacterium]
MENLLTRNVENAPRRSLYKSMGVTDNQLNKPVVGVIYSHNQTVPAHSDLDKFLNCICEGIISEGANAVLCSVMSVGSSSIGGLSGKYLLPSRELIADSIESLAHASGFDALVFVGSCDSTIPAMLIAAVRVNLPCIFVSPGISTAGIYKGKKIGYSQLLEAVYAVKSGKITAAELEEIENEFCGLPGSGSEMSNSNTMCCLTEVLGLSLPFSATLPKGCAKRFMLAKQSGAQVINILKQNITPKLILSLASLTNALRFIMATGGSPDSIMHLIALRHELEISEKLFSYSFIENISAKTPSIVMLAPMNDYYMEDFDSAGGVMAVLKELNTQKLIDGTALTILNKPLSALYRKSSILNEDIIRKIGKAYMKKGAVALLFGNIAEEGCFIRRLFVSEKNLEFKGTAKVFNSEEDALYALHSQSVGEGDCLVIRYEGPKGSPGMREMRLVCAAISGMGLENKTAVITDGRIGGTSKGFAVGSICPEAAINGNIALIEDGDIIEIDINKGKISANVPAKELNARRKRLKVRQTAASGYLLRYSEAVTAANHGAVLKDKF